jgi:VWFA-related protein
MAAAAAVLAAQEPKPSFSAAVDVVRVDADVRRDDKVVEGLTAADFEVLDKGVRQRVELVAGSSLPLNVVIALDTSASLDDRGRRQLSAAGQRVVDALQPAESAALVTFSDRLDVHSGFTTDRARLRELLDFRPGAAGDTILRDAVHGTMLIGGAAAGRPMIMLFSDGEDTASVLTPDAVLDTARRTGAVVCVVKLGGDDPLLEQLARTTGGLYLRETSLDKVAARFAAILETFRHRYLVSFSPTDRTHGWHALTVRVKDADVRARAGYWSDRKPRDR